MIQGVIFDMDGLMFDTERIWATLWEPALAGLGLSYKEGLVPVIVMTGTFLDPLKLIFIAKGCHCLIQ